MIHENIVWVVDDDRNIRWVLEKALSRAEYHTRCFDNGRSLLDALRVSQPHVIISDIRMPGVDGLELLAQVSADFPNIPVIITTAHSDLDSAVSSYQGGAFEYLPKPFDIEEALTVTQRAVKHARKQGVNSVPVEADTGKEIIGEAPAMQEVFRAIGRLSQSNITVLINGESGTGKELVAQALHRHSPRRDKNFIALNMAAIPHDLMESELFGHEKGAFTGANAMRQGRFEQADGGTLFLDEIGDMPAETQTRLLRVLADGMFYRVGGHTPVKVDVRIIAATHQNLEKLVAQNKFREDLFHRLNVIRIHIPSLSERREDIPALARHFLRSAAKELNAEVKTLLPKTEKFMASLAWPGNVRQLENTCRWITVMASGRDVAIEDLPIELTQSNKSLASVGADDGVASNNWQEGLRLWAQEKLAAGDKAIIDEATPMFERVMIEVGLGHSHGRKRDAAELLGWGRNTLTRKMTELKIDGDD